MSNEINAYRTSPTAFVVEPLSVVRDWMDATSENHAYRCFPVTQSNVIGWSLSCLQDIEFIWDGISDTTPDHVTILSGPVGVPTTVRGNATISFYSGFYFDTPENVSMLQIVPPNFFVDGATPFTTVISTSVLKEAIPIAWRITRPNTIIKIPAGMPVATFIPISLKEYQDVELEIKDKVFEGMDLKEQQKRQKVWDEITKKGGFTNFYRDAVDYLGNSIGSHEIKSLKLKITDLTSKDKK